MTGLTPQQWTWVDFPDAHCRNGDPTGIGVNVNPSSTNLMIFLEGGGACYNQITCATNASCFPKSGSPSCALLGSFDSFTTSRGASGVFNRADTQNPVADWNMIYVPFCTGDVHGGANPSGQVPGVSGTQEFVGYTNITKYLARIVPTFPNVTHVLLTGISAGGFGASINYLQVAAAFGSVPVDMLDDSGPLMEDPYASKCLQSEWATLWGLDKTALAACGSACPDPTNYNIDGARFVAQKFPDRHFGLIDSVDDGVITLFFGYGANNCSSIIPTALTPAQYLAGLEDMKAKLQFPNFGSFIFPGTDHTTLESSTFDTRVAGGASASPDAGTDGGGGSVDGGTAEGGTDASASDAGASDAGASSASASDGGGQVKLTDWMRQFLQGQVSNVGP
jgi:hypothetical protein